jgi:hypothetical protein
MTTEFQQLRQAVAVFDDRTKLDLARSEIEKFGPDGSDITLFAGRCSLADEVELAQIGLVRTSVPIFSSEGRLAEFFRLAGAGPGVKIKPILQSLIPAKHAAFLEQRLEAGEILLWIGIRDAEHEAAVCRILLKHSPYRVQVHDLKVGMQMRNPE